MYVCMYGEGCEVLSFIYIYRHRYIGLGNVFRLVPTGENQKKSLRCDLQTPITLITSHYITPYATSCSTWGWLLAACRVATPRESRLRRRGRRRL